MPSRRRRPRCTGQVESVDGGSGVGGDGGEEVHEWAGMVVQDMVGTVRIGDDRNVAGSIQHPSPAAPTHPVGGPRDQESTADSENICS
jgi:hypothetical protein